MSSELINLVRGSDMLEGLTMVYASRMKPSSFWRDRVGFDIGRASWLLRSSLRRGVRSAMVIAQKDLLTERMESSQVNDQLRCTAASVGGVVKINPEMPALSIIYRLKLPS